MRLVKVTCPKGLGEAVASLAFSCGIKSVSLSTKNVRHSDGKTEDKDDVGLETSTPIARCFVDALGRADFFDREQFTVLTRGAISITKSTSFHDLTPPYPEIAIEVVEDMWKFSHITLSFVARVFVAACLLAYGIINSKLLVMVAGLLFLPLTPLEIGIGLGVVTGKLRLSLSALMAFALAIVLLVAGGAVVGLITKSPIRFDDFGSIGVGFLLSLAIGVAAGFSSIDDVGKRELIGLAAAAQLALIPVWFGAALVMGIPADSHPGQKAAAFGINLVTIVGASMAVYLISGMDTEGSRSILRSPEARRDGFSYRTPDVSQ